VPNCPDTSARDLRIGNFHSNRITNRIGGYDSNSVSVYAVANYDVVIIKWCLKPGVASFILRHTVLYVLTAIKGRRRHRSAGARAGVRQRVGRGRGRPKAASVLSAC